MSDPGTVDERAWTWDPSLYAGSAGYYVLGRMPYPAEVAEAIVAALYLDGSGRLLDVGCGPGSLTLLLAPDVAEAIGVDADADMLAEAERQAQRRGIANASWRHMRAEDLPADFAPVRVVTFAQSFHWMDRPRVAASARGLLTDDGAVVHVGATTHQGVDDGPLSGPRPPWPAITELVRRYLGSERRAGQGVLPLGAPGGEEAVYRAAGLNGPRRLEIPGRTVERSLEQVVAAVHSLSGSAPHLFGARLGAFDRELRQLLEEHADQDGFVEQMRPIAVDIWRPS